MQCPMQMKTPCIFGRILLAHLRHLSSTTSASSTPWSASSPTATSSMPSHGQEADVHKQTKSTSAIHHRHVDERHKSSAKENASDDEQGHNHCEKISATTNNELDTNRATTTKKPTFDYESKFDELIERKKADNSYRVFRRLFRFSDQFPHGLEQGRPVTVWCSNDYFGMSSHPDVRKAAVDAALQYGTGSGGTRNIAGNSPLHVQLEQELADLHQKEAALLFSSCYVANESTLCTLARLLSNDCEIFSDADNHASMIQGIRNSGARKHIFRTSDPLHLESLLRKMPRDKPKIVAFETVHSMTGDVSPVERLCDIAHEYGALTYADEVHAVGLYGKHGAGIAERDHCLDKLDIVSGTLGKAYGNFGGYIAANAKLVDTIRCYAPGFIFTTSLPPTVVCGATASVRILKGPEGRRLRAIQQDNVLHMKRSLTAAGLPHLPSKSHIIPIPIGDAAKCAAMSSDLLENHAHYIQSINYPTVPEGTERLRVSVTPFHNHQMIDDLIERLVIVWRANNLNFLPSVEFTTNCGHNTNHNQQQEHSTDQQMYIPAGIGEPLWCHHCAKSLDFINLRAPSATASA